MPEPTGTPGAPSLAGRTVSLLLARAAEGDRESCAALVERVDPLLLMYARKQLRPPLDARYEPADIVNDAWARLLPRLAEIRPSDGRFAGDFSWQLPAFVPAGLPVYGVTVALDAGLAVVGTSTPVAFVTL